MSSSIPLLYWAGGACGGQKTWQSILSSMWVLGLKASCRAWWQTPLSTEPSYQPSTFFSETESLTEPGHW